MTAPLWDTDHDLTAANSLGLPAVARAFLRSDDPERIRAAVRRAREAGWPVHVLGGGSNLVLAPRLEALVVQFADASVRPSPADAEGGLWQIGGGASWPALVEQLAGAGWWGIENLALIPGTAGAAPIQNIGAYGAEFADVCRRVRVLDLQADEVLDLEPAQCGFGYRDSLFRRRADRYLVLTVDLQLAREGQPLLDYAGVEEVWREQGAIATPAALAAAVSTLRRSKLPDPLQEPNVGSFFKNPLVSSGQLARLREAWPDLAAHGSAARSVKLSAAWLIERAGLKGYREGAFEVSPRHALVIVHRGGGDGPGLIAFARSIIGRVRDLFDVELEIEPVLLGFDGRDGMRRGGPREGARQDAQ